MKDDVGKMPKQMTPEREKEIIKWFNTWKSAADTPTHFQVDGMMGDLINEIHRLRKTGPWATPINSTLNDVPQTTGYVPDTNLPHNYLSPTPPLTGIRYNETTNQWVDQNGDPLRKFEPNIAHDAFCACESCTTPERLAEDAREEERLNRDVHLIVAAIDRAARTVAATILAGVGKWSDSNSIERSAFYWKESGK